MINVELILRKLGKEEPETKGTNNQTSFKDKWDLSSTNCIKPA